MAHTAWIKRLTTKIDLRTKGIEVQVDDDDGQFGDIVVAKTGIEWCPGKTHSRKGKSTRLTFDQLDLICTYDKAVVKILSKYNDEEIAKLSQNIKSVQAFLSNLELK
jgi:hypothetical protein